MNQGLVILLVLLIFIILVAVIWSWATSPSPPPPSLPPDPVIKEEEVDYVIVGAGISGTYLASRLLIRDPDLKIVLLEKEERPGGRLYSVPFPEPQDINKFAELGGMRYFPARHTRVVELIRELGLTSFVFPVREVPPPLTKKIGEGVAIALKESGATIEQVLENEAMTDQGFINSLVPNVTEDEIRAYAREDGYNILEDLLSFHVGAGTFVLFGAPEQWELTTGYASLVTSLISQYNLDVRYQTSVLTVDMAEKEVVTSGRCFPTYRARQEVIVCTDFYEMARLGLLTNSFLRRTFNPFVASKIYLYIPEPWWDESLYGLHVTENPLRQVWYWNKNWIQIYADQEDGRFWSIYLKWGVLNTLSYPVEDLPPDMKSVPAPREGEIRIKVLELLKRGFETKELPFTWEPNLAPENLGIGLAHYWNNGAFFWKPLPGESPVLALQQKMYRRNLVSGDYSNHQGWVEGALESVQGYLRSKDVEREKSRGDPVNG